LRATARGCPVVSRNHDRPSGPGDTRRLRLPCSRTVRASLDGPEVVSGSDADPASGTESEPTACVVACPPHPQHGGSRSDPRLRAVADALTEHGVACLRFDYGPWDEGRGERRDAACALDWASERYERVRLFGYSFGGAVALRAAIERDGDDNTGQTLDRVAVLAPASTLPDGSDAAAAVGGVTVPTLVVSGERDDTVDWRPVVETAGAAGHAVEAFTADHYFVGQHQQVAATVAPFLAGQPTDRTV